MSLGSGKAALRSRPASAADEAFRRTLYFAGRARELAAWPISEQERKVFCNRQFDAREAAYRSEFPKLEIRIAEKKGVAVGAWMLAENASELHLLDIAVSPAKQRSGIGTALMRILMQQCSEQGKVLKLYAELHGQALGWYQRLGFQPDGRGDGFRSGLSWPACTSGIAVAVSSSLITSSRTGTDSQEANA